MIVLDPLFPAAYVITGGVLASILTVWVYWTIGDRLRAWQNVALLGMRLAAVWLVILILLQPSRREEIVEARLDSVVLVGVDRSGSMAQTDADGGTRLQTAATLVRDKLLANMATDVEGGQRAKIYAFADDALTIEPTMLDGLQPDGKSTQFHTSVSSMVDELLPHEIPSAIVLLSDGHDHELINPARTAIKTRARHVPLYTVAVGDRGKVRDLSVAITNFQHYGYVKQTFRIDAAIRQIGCEFADVAIDLLREGEVVRTVERNLGELRESAVSFEVREEKPNQYEYAIAVRELPGEVTADNNVAHTYVNVIDHQIRVLMLEGDPHWDSTFLRRALFRNDKFNVDAIVQFRAGKSRLLRSESREPLTTPSTIDAFAVYDVVILGRSVERILDDVQRQALSGYVSDHGGCVIYSRGNAFSEASEDGVEPVLWDEAGYNAVSVGAASEGGQVSAIQLVANRGPESENPMTAPVGVRKIASRKSLASALAVAKDAENDERVPAIIHRRQGRGQVLSVGVDGLWRWAFNDQSDADVALYNRFWDNLVLWMLAGSDYMPSNTYSFRANTANVPLGNKIYFRLGIRNREALVPEAAVEISREGKPVGSVTLSVGSGGTPSRLTGDFDAEQPGRYLAKIRLPDETSQEIKFMVFSDNRELTEVAVDRDYLSALADAGGGKLLTPEELAALPKSLLQRQSEGKAKVRLTSIWDRLWVFYLIVALFAADWYLRRKWGLC